MAKNFAPKNISSPGQTVDAGAIKMYYEEYGTGDPLLLLHGFGGCSQNWHDFTGELALKYRLIVVDLRGHGYSTNDQNIFSHRQAAKDVFLLLEKLGIDHFSAMGMSTGGMILLHMAVSAPERLRSMVLISATTHFPEQARFIMKRASFATMPDEVKEMYRECAKRGDEQIVQLIKQFNAFYEDTHDVNFTKQELSTITATTLIVHGDRDNFFPVEIALQLYRSIPRSSLWIIPGGEHVPIFNSSIPFVPTALKFIKEAQE
jgi:pimeloyl-ACP methyl ester carboxylesterase